MAGVAPTSVPKDYRDLKYETLYISGIDNATGKAISDPRIVQLTLNRPPANTFIQKQAYEIAAAFQLFDTDRRVKCVIITGHGDKFFSAGAELADPSALSDGNGEREYRDG